MMGRRVLLGRGRLGFSAVERRSDRYGSVRLFNDKDDDLPFSHHDCEGKLGRLVAVVSETRPCEHVGDLLRGIYPPKQPPEVGSEFILGPKGELTFEHFGGEAHEKGEFEKQDEEMMGRLEKELKETIGVKPVSSLRFGVVFKVEWEDQKEYLVLTKWKEDGQVDPEVTDVPEIFREKHQDMPLDEIEVVQILSATGGGDRLREVATISIEHKDGEGTAQKMLEDPVVFGRMMAEIWTNLQKAPREELEYETVGIKPLDGRGEDWMDPHQLFQVIQQTVDLYFEIEK